MRQQLDSLKKRALPLQWVLIVPFVLQIFGAVGLVGYLSFKNGEKAVRDLANQVIDRTSSQVNQHLEAYLTIPHQVNQINANALRMGLFDGRDRQAMGKFFWHQMKAYDLSYIAFNFPSGEGAGVARYDGKTITLDEVATRTPSRPRNATTYATDNDGNVTQKLFTSPWDTLNEVSYTEPIKAGKPIWTRIYTYYDPTYPPYVAASAGRPVYDDQKRLLGVVAVDIHLLKLSEFLRQLDISRSGEVMILERDGMLVANSAPEEPFTLDRQKQEVKRIKATDSTNPVIKSLATQIQQRIPDLKAITEVQNLHLNWQGEHYHVHIQPWRDAYGLDWLVVTSVPERSFMARINANSQTTLWLCLGAFVSATVIGLFTARRIVGPILRLNQASQLLAMGNLKQTVRDSNIEEFNLLTHSFNHMAGQLRDSFAALEKGNGCGSFQATFYEGFADFSRGFLLISEINPGCITFSSDRSAISLKLCRHSHQIPIVLRKNTIRVWSAVCKPKRVKAWSMGN